MHNLYSYKSTPLKIKDVDTVKGIVSGYFSAFGIKDSDNDIIQKGAYAKTIAERGPKSTQPRIKHLLDHSTAKVIGVLQELEEDNYGLAYVSKLGSHTLGKDAAAMYADGIITEHSVGFKTVNAKSDQDGTNIITEIMLWEGSSLQAWGANQYTPVTGIKSDIKANTDALFERWNRLTKALRSGTYSDETFELLEIESNQIQQAIKSLAEPPALGTQPEPTNEAAILSTLKSFRNDLNLI